MVGWKMYLSLERLNQHFHVVGDALPRSAHPRIDEWPE
jgi:hypothetical protein